jgi:hypothetical protein
LNTVFLENNLGSFKSFYKKTFKTLTVTEDMEIGRRIQNICDLLKNFLPKERFWYEFWRISNNIILLDFITLLKHVNAFCPSIHDELCP